MDYPFTEMDLVSKVDGLIRAFWSRASSTPFSICAQISSNVSSSHKVIGDDNLCQNNLLH
jgi:hypothetical protein